MKEIALPPNEESDMGDAYQFIMTKKEACRRLAGRERQLLKAIQEAAIYKEALESIENNAEWQDRTALADLCAASLEKGAAL